MSTALVTGASAGLGVEFARLFAADGYNLLLVARREDRLIAVKKELEDKYKITVQIKSSDLSQPNSAQELWDWCQQKNLKIEFLVNNAGFGSNDKFSVLPREKELEMVDLNIRTLVGLTHLFMQPMLKAGFGRILNLGSTAGFQPGPYMATYYASKAFVNSFSEALWYELKGTGVTCTVLAPGPTATEFADVAGNKRSLLFSMAVDTPDKVARVGYKAMLKGKCLAIPNFKFRMLLQSLRLSPRKLVLSMVARMNS